MGVYLRAKLEVSSVILKSFRQGGNVTPHPTPTSKRTPKKPTQIRVKVMFKVLPYTFILINKEERYPKHSTT